MKRLIIILFIALCISSCSNAEETTRTVPCSTVNTVNNFLLYPTTNMWTFIKLDTRNGKLWQVQYSIDGDEFETILSERELATDGMPGQFVLYPTSNMWTFLLLNSENGSVYHVQWNQDADKRIVYPIHNFNQ